VLARSKAFYRAAFGWPARVKTPAYVEVEPPDGRGLHQREGDAWRLMIGNVTPVLLARKQRARAAAARGAALTGVGR
jgi:hypothetical protein